MDKQSLQVLFLIVFIYQSVLIIRIAYLSYIKAPKEIKRLKAEQNEVDLGKWQAYLDKSRGRLPALWAIMILTIILFLS